MNAINLKNGGKIYKIDTEGHAKQKGIPATGDTRWSFLGSELGLPELDPRINEILKRDDKFKRAQFMYAYESSHAAILDSGLRQCIITTRSAALNKELRSEVRSSKIIVAASEGLAMVRVALEPIYDQFFERVSQARRVYDLALTPAGDPVGLAIRGREVRDALRRSDRGAAVNALMAAAQSGSVEAVYAAAHDPMNSEVVPQQVLQQAQHLALDAVGLGWIWQNLKNEMNLLPELAGRFDQLESLFLSVLSAAPFSVRLSRPDGPAFYNLAVAHVENLNANKPAADLAA